MERTDGQQLFSIVAKIILGRENHGEIVGLSVGTVHDRPSYRSTVDEFVKAPVLERRKIDHGNERAATSIGNIPPEVDAGDCNEDVPVDHLY
jgi:hypothetical protein